MVPEHELNTECLTCVHLANASRFNYKPVILRFWALGAFLSITITLVCLLEFAVFVLPHSDVRLPVSSSDLPEIHVDLKPIAPRQVSTITHTCIPQDGENNNKYALDQDYIHVKEIWPTQLPFCPLPTMNVGLPTSEPAGLREDDAQRKPFTYWTTGDTYTPQTSLSPNRTTLHWTSLPAPTTSSSQHVSQTAMITTPVPSFGLAKTASGTVHPQALPTTDGDAEAENSFKMANKHENGSEIVYTWSTAQVFVGTYLPVLVAVLYRILWSILHNRMSLIDPFRQMLGPNGAHADRALFSFYHSRSSVLDPVKALFGGRWTLLGSATGVALTYILPALASEAIWVDTNWDCSNPRVGNENPCPARMTVSVLVARVIQALLIFLAGTIFFIIVALARRSTGLFGDPSSIAAIASMMRHPSLAVDFDGVQNALRTNTRSAKRLMAGKRYKLGFWVDSTGAQHYGIRSVHKFRGRPISEGSTLFEEETEYQGVNSDSLDAPPAKICKPVRWGLRDLALVLMVSGAFGVILAYSLDQSNDNFNRFFNRYVAGPILGRR